MSLGFLLGTLVCCLLDNLYVELIPPFSSVVHTSSSNINILKKGFAKWELNFAVFFPP